MKKENARTHVTDFQCRKWILETAQGNTEAFRLLYEILYQPALLFALSISGDRMLAEDIVQDTFLKVYQNAGQHQGKAAVKTWIFSIIKHLCLNAQKNMQAEKPPFETLGIMSDFSKPEVVEALALLNEEERQVIVLHVFGGFRIKEIAELLPISKQQAYHRNRTATEKLKVYYGKNN